MRFYKWMTKIESYRSKKKMRMFYLDIPHLHKRTKEGRDFIRALKETSDFELFKLFPVQAIVDYHWRTTRY
jgi:prephenate dehydratase